MFTATKADGPFGGDEVNLIEGGRNYGWPIHSFGRRDRFAAPGIFMAGLPIAS